MGAFRVSSFGSRFNKPFDQVHHDEATGDIDLGHQLCHEGNFEPRALPFDHEPVLGNSGDKRRNHPYVVAVRVSGSQTYEVLGPVLVLAELATLGCQNIVASDGLGGDPGVDPVQFEMVTSVGATDRTNEVWSAFDKYGFAGLEMDEVVLVHIEADMPVEAVGTTEPPDHKTGFSR